jgi:hypothetical protein
MEIRILKLVTGEEIIGELITDGGKFRIKNPVIVAVMRGKDGTPNVGFAPFPTYAEEVKDAILEFRLEHVVYSYVPAADFCKNYEQIFGLGLILPGDKKIITG